jgi:hypothetical protein
MLRPPFTVQRSVDYIDGMWEPARLPSDLHMLIVRVSDVATLARDSKLIQAALSTVRAIVFILPESTRGELNAVAADVLALGNALRYAAARARPAVADAARRPSFYVVTGRDMNASPNAVTQKLDAPAAVVAASAADAQRELALLQARADFLRSAATDRRWMR